MGKVAWEAPAAAVVAEGAADLTTTAAPAVATCNAATAILMIARPIRITNRPPITANRASSSRALGVLELHPNGYGFLRDPKNNYLRERTDPFVPGTMIDKFGLREGVLINGMVQQAASSRARG